MEGRTMKTNEKHGALKKEVEAENAKLTELTEEELAQVSGGITTGGGGVFTDLGNYVIDTGRHRDFSHSSND